MQKTIVQEADILLHISQCILGCDLPVHWIPVVAHWHQVTPRREESGQCRHTGLHAARPIRSLSAAVARRNVSGPMPAFDNKEFFVLAVNRLN